MKFNLKKKFLSVALVACLGFATIPMQGCSTAWVTTFDNILIASAPALIDILNIIAIAQGKPMDSTLVAKITADTATLKATAADFAAASASAAPTACAQLQAAIQVYATDEAQVVALISSLDPATQSKVAALSALVAGTVTAILAVIPSCQQAATMKASFEKTAVPLPLKTFVDSYNTVLVAPTGNAKVDAFTKAHKIHVHSKLVRVLTFGRAS